MSTPPSMRGSAASIPPPPPSPLATAADSTAQGASSSSSVPASPAPEEDPLAGVPELRSYRAEKEEDKVAALKLVADGVAQMRQTANNTLISHPLNLAVAVAALALFCRVMYDTGKDPATILLGCVGGLMVSFAACRFLTERYLHAAEEIGWEWLGDADVLVTEFGDEIIGTVIVDWLSGDATTTRQKRKKACRGEIKAWAVRMRYRKKGVGSALLQDAVDEAKSKGAEGIGFADAHASMFYRHLPLLPSSPADMRLLQTHYASCRSFTASLLTNGKKGPGSCCKICSTPMQTAASASRNDLNESHLL